MLIQHVLARVERNSAISTREQYSYRKVIITNKVNGRVFESVVTVHSHEVSKYVLSYKDPKILGNKIE